MSASAKHSNCATAQHSGTGLWLRRLRSVLFVLVLLALLAYAGLQTSLAKQWLVTYLNTQLSTADQQVHMEGLTGWLPHHMQLTKLSLSDAQGPWLRLHNVTLTWSPLQWFKGRILITDLGAQQGQLLRLPETSGSSPLTNNSVQLTVPAITVSRLHLAKLSVPAALTGKAHQLGIDGRLQVAANISRIQSDFTLTGDVTLKAQLNLAARDDSLLDGNLTLAVQAQQQHGQLTFDYAVQGEHLKLSRLRTDLPGAILQGRASIHLASGLTEGTINTDITDAAKLSVLIGQPVQGRLNLTASLNVVGDRQDLLLQADANNLAWSDVTSGTAQLSAEMTDLFGQARGQGRVVGKNIHWQHHQLSHLSLTGSGNPTQGQMDVNAIGVSGQPFTLNNQLQWQRQPQNWQVTLGATEATYDRVRFCIKPQDSLFLKQRGTQPMELGIQACELSFGERTCLLGGTLHIALPVPRLYGELTLKGTPDTTVKLDLTLPISQPEGTAQLTITRNDIPVQAHTRYAWRDTQLDLSELTMATPGAELKGQAVIQLNSGQTIGKVQTQVADANALAQFCGYPAQGQGQARLLLGMDGHDQIVEGHWEISKVRWSTLDLDSLVADVSLRVNDRHVTGNACTVGQGLTWDRLQLDQILLEASGDRQSVTLNAMTQGLLGRPFAVETHGVVNLNQANPLLVLDQAQVQYGSQQLILNQAATLWRHQQDDAMIYALEDWVWQDKESTLSLTGWFSRASLALQASLQNMDLALVTETSDLVGTVNGTLTLNGSPQQPCFESKTQIRGLGLRDSRLPVVTRLDADIDTQLTGQDLYTDIQLSTPQGDQVKVYAGVPVSFSLMPWHWTIHDQDLKAKFNADADVALLDWLPLFREAVLQGRVQADMAYTGSLTEGAFSGSAQWMNGYYEDFILGTVIPNIHATLQAQGRGLTLSAKTLNNAHSGQVSALGQVQLSQTEKLPYRIELTADRFPWIQRSDVTAIASGKLTLSGSLHNVQLQGNLKVDEGLLDLSALPPLPLPRLIPNSPISVQISPVTDPCSVVTLIAQGGLSLDLGEKFQVIGLGLTSIWKGQINLVLANDHWDITGSVSPKRGDFRIMGRPFHLAQGSIRLDGTSPVDPILDLTAIHRRSGIEARVRITGRLSNPIVTIESEPALPEDAILATVLFGKDLGTITAMQAVQLSAAIKSLHSPGGGIDLFRSTRQTLRVDYIDIQTPDEQVDGLSVTVGKYVRPDIYVEVQRPLNQQGVTSTHVEYEIRPNLTLETDAGPGIRSGLGLNWKKDY